MTDKIYKKDLAERLAEEFDLTQQDAIAQTDFIFEQMIIYLQKGCNITITNFGNFSLKERNSKDKESINYINFKMAKKIKEQLNK